SKAELYQVSSSDTSHLSPLSRYELAALLSLHPSTVGRSISGKYLQNNGTVYAFSHFFTQKLPTQDGAVISSYGVQQHIRRLVSLEADSAPLSDQDIVEKLRADGVDIARRTVAKYRRCMTIPSSFERRRLKATRRTRPVPPGCVKSVKQ
ncbi:MAG: hypothetical protein ACC631_09425, partial [Halocynthiibacter sp.]